jgi:hypothetical protein
LSNFQDADGEHETGDAPAPLSTPNSYDALVSHEPT